MSKQDWDEGYQDALAGRHMQSYHNDDYVDGYCYGDMYREEKLARYENDTDEAYDQLYGD